VNDVLTNETNAPMNAALPYLSHRWFAPGMLLVAALIGPWMTSESPWTWAIVALLFCGLGIPHGAVDHITYHHALGRNDKNAPWYFLGPYLLGLCLVAATLLLWPVAATWAFLVMSAWHFGQSHVEVRTEEWLDRIRGFVLGAVLLGTLLSFKQPDAEQVMTAWMSPAKAHHMLDLVAISTGLSKLLWTLLAAWSWKQSPNPRRMSLRLLREAAWVIAMWTLAQSADLLWAFTSYFCIGHAADSMRAEFLHHQRLTRLFWTYYSWSIPFTLTTLAGLGLISLALFSGVMSLQVTWALIIAATVPHMVLLDHWAPAKLRSLAGKRA
jgi:Brp/Blh family beta-carotene 15,15'-monooxygenase